MCPLRWVCVFKGQRSLFALLAFHFRTLFKQTIDDPKVCFISRKCPDKVSVEMLWRFGHLWGSSVGFRFCFAILQRHEIFAFSSDHFVERIAKRPFAHLVKKHSTALLAITWQSSKYAVCCWLSSLLEHTASLTPETRMILVSKRIDNSDASITGWYLSLPLNTFEQRSAWAGRYRLVSFLFSFFLCGESSSLSIKQS